MRRDEAGRLRSTTRYRFNFARIVPSSGSALTLALRLHFQNIADQILFGTVGVVISERSPWRTEGKPWYSLTDQAINVKEMGALGDGATDDLPAFLAALQA